MRVLYVYSGNNGKDAPFITEQIGHIPDIEFEIHRITRTGILGYLKHMIPLLRQARRFEADVVHAHFGLSGLLVGLLPTRRKKVVTFHGSDINNKKTRFLSRLAHALCHQSIFVSEKLRSKLGVVHRTSVVPCGVDLELFKPEEKAEAIQRLGLRPNKRYVLFSSSFKNDVKDPDLAFRVIESLEPALEVELLELVDRNREEVAALLNASDVALMTSKSEGSPQFIKEALACNRPIVSTDVGDVKELMADAQCCFVTKRDAGEMAQRLKQIFADCRDSNGRQSVEHLDLRKIGMSIRKIYANSFEDDRTKN